MADGTTSSSRKALAAAIAAARAASPEATMVELFALSLNGVAHGKRVPLAALEKFAAGAGDAPKFQISLAGLDIFGTDVPESGIAMEIGDPDGFFVPLPHTLAPLPFATRPTLALQGMIAMADGSLSPYDPRGVLVAVLEQAAARGLTPVVALELEFYLVDPVAPEPACHPLSGARLAEHQMMDLDLQAAFDPILADITDAAAALGAPTETVLCEFGAGQFEINLGHVADAAKAADQLVALKRAIRAAARHHGLDASFMAKPFTGWSGSGLHIHLSLLDGEGRNVFDEPGEPVGARLGHAIGGLAATTRETFLMLAPHLNSYRRHRPGSYAPTGTTWGIDNRGAAFRVPAVRGPGARLEHRIAGADANPYLATAAVVAGVIHGLDERLSPGPMSAGEEADAAAVPFPQNWPEALAAFEASPRVKAAFGRPFAHVFAAIKRKEEAELRGMVSEIEHALYLRRV